MSIRHEARLEAIEQELAKLKEQVAALLKLIESDTMGKKRDTLKLPK